MPWDACLVETDTATRLLMQRALQAVLGQRAAIACAGGRDQGLAVARMLPPAGRQGAMAELAIVDGELPDWGCIEILGPLGVSREHLLEKWFRDVRITDIYEGTGQIQRLILARSILGYSSKELK